MTNPRFSVAAVGNVRETKTFSGTPYHFWATAMTMGEEMLPWEVDLDAVSFQRKLWNATRLLMGSRPGGYQYSDAFHNKLLTQIPAELLRTNVISFNQHFPAADVVKKNGGRMFYYIDATFRQLLDRYGVSAILGKKIIEQTLIKEKDSFEKADHVFTMQQWARQSVISDYNIDPGKITAVLPGANIMFPAGYKATPPAWHSGFTSTRPLVLGFVGKDWQRKGLPILAAVRDELELRGQSVIIRCAGHAPNDLTTRKGIEFAGFIDKHNNYPAFISFLESCDIGCLFSKAEFSSISVLEFISTGRPVAGFVVDGMGDLFMPDLSMRFSVDQDIKVIADTFERFITDAAYRNGLATSAVSNSNHVRWDRTVTEILKKIRGL